MILVGLGLTFHDSSVAIYDNGKVIYWKAERESGQKHDHASVQAQLKKASSIVSGKIDEIAITGWSGADPKFLEKDNVSWINHHYAHVLSNTKKFDSNLVVDGAYTSPYNPQHQSNKGMGTPHLDEELVQFNVEKQKIRANCQTVSPSCGKYYCMQLFWLLVASCSSLSVRGRFPPKAPGVV